MHYKYQTNNTCAKQIEYDIDNQKVTNIKFIGGCPGNLKMLSKILDGWKVDDIIKICKGNTCGIKKTSCADQLALSLEKAKQKQEA